MTGWTVVLPVKDVDQAKGRLAPDVGPWRRFLAAAFASDVLDAILAVTTVDRVLIIGGDGIDAPAMASPRVVHLPDIGDLDAAVTLGTTRARETDAGCRVLVLQADLPCLLPGDLQDLVEAAPWTRPGVVPDTEGLGTVALTMPPGVTLTTSFGAGSFARHVEAGADPIDRLSPRLRRDVDTLEHLHAAVRLGVGGHTRAVLEQMRFPPARDRPA